MDTTPQNNWLIYILECRDDSLYCGITNNLEKRLKQHNGEIKGGAKYTRPHWPCKLVYKEKSASRSEASQREAIIKKMSKDEKQALINLVQVTGNSVMGRFSHMETDDNKIDLVGSGYHGIIK